MKKKDLKNKIDLKNQFGKVYDKNIAFKEGDFLKVVILKRDPLTLRGYFEEIKGFCVGKSRKKGGALKLANIIKQIRFYYHFHLNSISVKSIKKVKGKKLSKRELIKKA